MLTETNASYITTMNKTAILLIFRRLSRRRRGRCNRAAVLVLNIALLAACASPIPKAIQEPPKPAVSLRDIHAATGPLPVDTRVRWGGAIAALEHKENQSWLEIVERPLDRDGRPERGDRSGGRFLARVDGFLEPTVYKKGRLITVSGVLENRERRRIGDYDYDYVVVKVLESYLWPRQTQRAYLEPLPYGWYGPWYPWGWGPYPYYHRYRPFAY